MENIKHAIQPNIDRIKTIDFSRLVFEFLGCGFLGWVWETSVMFCESGHLTNRGILFVSHPEPGVTILWGLPIIFIYGIGGVVILNVLRRLNLGPFKLFLTGAGLMTLLEWGASYIPPQRWDYSQDWLNYHGRICFLASAAWGVLTVVGVYWAAPWFDKWYERLRERKHFQAVIYLLFLWALVCMQLREILFPV